MRKRMTSLLLTLVMLLSLVPAMSVTASAGEMLPPLEVGTYQELRSAILSGKSRIKLKNDINTRDVYASGVGIPEDKMITIGHDADITLDLNGCTLALETLVRGGISFFTVYGKLEIKDSSPGQNGKITGKFPAVLASMFSTRGGTLTLQSGTLMTYSNKNDVITVGSSGGHVVINGGRICSGIWDTSSASPCGYAVLAVTGFVDVEEMEVIINGGVFDGAVGFFPLSEFTCEEPRFHINGGTFKKDVLLRCGQKTFKTHSPILEIRDGSFEGGLKIYDWGMDLIGKAAQSYPPFKLLGGTFSCTMDLCYEKSSWGFYSPNLDQIIDVLKYERMGPVFAAMFENSAIVKPSGIYTADNIGKGIDWAEREGYGGYYQMLLKGTADNPVRIIPNAWGMESVTLDTNKINYAKDWKGAVERMDNSTAHTIKFTWKPLASELVNAGYSYRAECDRYISGSKTSTTDTISDSATEYSFTIPAGADPKVYSFDLKLNLKKDGSSVGIFSNEHIVKLVVNQAPVVVPDPTLEGKVYYTSGIVFGRSISTGTSGIPDGAVKAYQWQRSTDGGSTWTNIEGATNSQYKPTADDMGDTVRIRVKITANGYLGEIVGAAVKVSKAANDNTPAPPAVAAQKDDSGAYKKFVISDFNSDKQEYVYTDSPASGSGWPSGTPISSATVEELDTGRTYYIYTRFKETDTHTAGSKISSSSVLLDDVTKLNRIILTDESSGKVYGSYGNGNTIYIKKGESVTLTATKNPDGANKWSAFTFKSQYDASAPFTVTAPTAPVASGAEIPSVTIHGNEAGTGTLAAEYGGYPAAQSYGTWRVHVYENVSDIGTDAEITVSPSFPDMTMYQGETMPLPEYTVTMYPEGALENYDLAWRIVNYGPSYKTSDDNITLKDGEIEATKAHTGSKNTRIALVAINKDNNNYISSLSDFYVTVTKAPTIALTGLTVAPTKVNLEKVNDTCQLSAVKEPVNAASILTWSSDNETVATVDNTGKVTAHALGTATIKVTCGGKEATCTVTVHTHDTEAQPWVYMDPGTHTKTCTAGDNFKAEAHTFSAWKKVDDTNHSRTCTACKMTDGSVYTETASHNWQWVVDTYATSTTAGKKHEECPDCHAKRNEGTVIPATGGGSSSGGSSGGAGVTTYAITVQNSKNGGVTASHKSAAKDTAVTLTVTPDKGYVLDTLTVLDSKDKALKLTEKNGKYTFTMPSGKVTVSAAFKAAAPASENPFTDVPSGAYYEDAVVWAVKKDITSGTSATTFNPDGSCTRAQAVTFLWRAAGSPEPKSAAMPFTDVPAGSYFEKAVLWAVENGITKGTSDTAFSPNASCTRAQIVTFLWRANGSHAVSGNSAFTDVASDAYYAAAVAWAEKNGVTGGIGGGLFGPDNTCTRAQIVTFLYRAMK